MSADPRHSEIQALEGRLAARLAVALAEQPLPHDVAERLRVARERALVQARHARAAAAEAASATAIVGQAGAGAALRGIRPWWQRAAAVLPLIVLVLGLLAVERFAEREQVLAAAEIDAQLLADDLPPAAYSDPGFGEFLRSPPP